MNSTKRSKTKKARTGRSATDQVPKVKRNNLTVVPRASGLIVPDRMYTKLRFFGASTISFVIGDTVHAKRWRPTAAFDVDPLLGSTATPGFAEFSTFYSSYRVTSSNFRAEFTQTSTVGLTAIIVPLNADPGATPTFTTAASWASLPFAKHKMLPPAGSPTVTLSQSMSTEKIFGSDMVYFDDNFASLVTTVPNNNWYWAIGVIASPAVGGLVNVNFMADIELGIEFYDRIALTS
jgi:hypothetical protein